MHVYTNISIQIITHSCTVLKQAFGDNAAFPKLMEHTALCICASSDAFSLSFQIYVLFVFFQSTNIIFLSQQISQQYFQPWLISQTSQNEQGDCWRAPVRQNVLVTWTRPKGSISRTRIVQESYMDKAQTYRHVLQHYFITTCSERTLFSSHSISA